MSGSSEGVSSAVGPHKVARLSQNCMDHGAKKLWNCSSVRQTSGSRFAASARMTLRYISTNVSKIGISVGSEIAPTSSSEIRPTSSPEQEKDAHTFCSVDTSGMMLAEPNFRSHPLLDDPAASVRTPSQASKASMD
eukprot:COSAG02_NODE_2290_length_9205_cov_21.549198_1_plen_135_part_10